MQRIQDVTQTALRWASRNPFSPSPLTRGEVAFSAWLILLLSLGICMRHIIDGGWYLDDWIHVAQMSEAGGPLAVVDKMSELSYRPGLAFSLSVFYWIAGTDPTVYLVIGAVLAAIQGWLFYLVLRMVGLRQVVAAVAAAFFVVLPVIDSTRLWFSAFPIQVAGVLYLLGVIIALHALTNASGRRAIAWHGGAVALYFAAVLTYELVAGLIVLTPLLYAIRCSDWRRAARRALPDYAAIGLALAIIAPRGASDREAQASLGFFWERLNGILEQAEAVFRALLPFSEQLGTPVGLILLFAATLGVGVGISRRDEIGDSLRSWLKIGVLSTAFALAGLVMLLPADPYFVPRLSGLGNRTGAFAAFGASVLLIAFLMLALGGLSTLLRRPRIGLLLGTALVVATGFSLASTEYRQQQPWVDSWREQQEVVAAVETAMDDEVPPEAGIVSFHHTTFILPADVSVFAYSWDLHGALWETYGRSDISAQPWMPGMSCGPEGVVVPDRTTPAGSGPFAYEDAFFVDAATETAIQVEDQQACEAAIADLTAPLPPA